MCHSHFQVVDQLNGSPCIEADATAVTQGCSLIQRCGKEGDVASGAMVWAPTQSRGTSRHKCSEGRYHKDLVNAVIGLHLEVALVVL